MRESQYLLSGEVPSGQYVQIDPGGDPGLFRVGKPKLRSAFPDCVNSDNLDLIVSSRFAQVLSDIGATGYEVTPVQLLRGDEELTGYGRLVVTGSSPRSWFGFHDEHVREKQYVEDGPWVPEHACFDPAPDGWDGSDLYTPEETGYVVITQRVKDAADAAELAVWVDQVGRHISLLASGDLSADDAWRQRTGIQPGQRQGIPVCPVLLDGDE